MRMTGVRALRGRIVVAGPGASMVSSADGAAEPEKLQLSRDPAKVSTMATEAATSEPAALPASATSATEETARLDQALEDLNACESASVSLIHCPSATKERALGKDLAAKARDRGFVTAEVSLREHGLDSPDSWVREVLEKIAHPSEPRARGLLKILDHYREKYRGRSGEKFKEGLAAFESTGDLAALCEAYLSAEDPQASGALRAYTAWCDGVEPPRKYRNRAVRRALSERTAQRSFNELTRIVCALGHRGLLVLLSECDALASRTERQREKAYTVLRELVDNFDGAGGAVAMRMVLTGQSALFEGAHSIRAVVPLRMRLEIPADARPPPPPHRSWTTLVQNLGDRKHRRLRLPEERKQSALRNLIRISEGLPPTEHVTQMSVGQERLDRTIKRLFEIVSRTGSFFSVLVGEYGSGKTHLMMHLAERALEDNRPVFWLNLERTNLDLGNPARHLTRLLEHSQLPIRSRPNAIELATRWTRTQAAVSALMERLAEVEKLENSEASAAARKALRIAESARDRGFALESFLVGADLEKRPGDPIYRHDAYRRVFLWFELLARLSEIRGPVILIDEAENLYTSGRPPASRRTSLRSLSFYCGGALPGTCVILAMTPPAFEEMKSEARDLLAEAGDMDTTLELENVERFRRSLWGLKPDPVKPLTRTEREELSERVRRMHKAVRGPVEIETWKDEVKEAITAHASPRTLIRALVDRLEVAWWSGA
jgi:bacteriophage exclusion system BrxC/D-like protein